MNFRKRFNAVVGLLALSICSQAFATRTTTYYYNDGLGSVAAATTEAGQVLWGKDNAPFGEQIDTTPYRSISMCIRPLLNRLIQKSMFDQITSH